MDFLKLLDSHVQEYETSCSPSLIEILLKSEGLVPLDWFEEQKKHKDKGQNVGLLPYLNQNLFGARIKRIQDELSPGESFEKRIGHLLSEGKVLGIYLKNQEDDNFHGWAIYGFENGHYLAASKAWNDETQKGDITLRAKIQPQYLEVNLDRDCIYLECPST